MLSATLNQVQKAGFPSEKFFKLTKKIKSHVLLIGLDEYLEYLRVEDVLWIMNFCSIGKELIPVINTQIALSVLPFYEEEYPGDTRPRKAIIEQNDLNTNNAAQAAAEAYEAFKFCASYVARCAATISNLDSSRFSIYAGHAHSPVINQEKKNKGILLDFLKEQKCN